MPTPVSRQQYLLGLGFLIIAALGLYGLLPRFSNFDSSMQALRQATPGLVVVALIMSLLSSICSAGLYQLLSFTRLRFSNTALVQFAGLFVNRVLPSGIGGLGLNFLYLRKYKHSVSQATTVVALNNLLGLAGHLLLAVVILGGYTLFGQTLDVRVPTISSRLLIVVASLVLLISLAFVVTRHRSPGLVGRISKQLRALGMHYARHRRRLLLAVCLSMALTMCNVISLWICCQALDISVSFVAVFLIFTFGIAAGTATPTPGGLGGIEAALVAGLVSQQVPLALALAAALLYRLISFWVGLVIGVISLIGIKQRHLLATN